MSRWLRFLTEAATWTDVPEDLRDPVMEEAMDQLEHMQQNTQFNHAYRTRMEAIRREKTREAAMARAEENARLAEEALRVERERADENARKADENARKAAEAERENERLLALLRAAGLKDAS